MVAFKSREMGQPAFASCASRAKCLRQFHDHLANILSVEKAYERGHRLVYPFHHCFFVFQFAGFEVATSLFPKLG
jgi:hypothetical protein